MIKGKDKRSFDVLIKKELLKNEKSMSNIQGSTLH